MQFLINFHIFGQNSINMVLNYFKKLIIFFLSSIFRFFYQNIKVYTMHKFHINENWFIYMSESYVIVSRNIFKLVFYII